MLSSFYESPTAENAKLDKIQVTLGVWTLQYHNDGDLAQFLSAIQAMSGRNPANYIEGTSLGEDGANAQFGWIFNNRQNHSNRITLSIRQKDRRVYERRPAYPLFSGSLIITLIRQPSNSEPLLAQIRAKLSINPTRFAHHQHPHGIAPYRIWTNPIRRRRAPFPSLTGNDNVLTGVAEETYSQPERWNSLLRQYWGSIVICLNSEFQRAIETTSISMEALFSPDINVSNAEVYWEVKDEDAIERVKAIEPILTRIGRSNSISKYPTIIRGREVNCPSIRTKFNQGLEISVYAKTEKRIRLELKFNLRKYQIEGGHTSTELGFLPQLCQFLCSKETNKMEAIFEEIREIENSNSDLHTLLGLILDASESTNQAKTVLNLLISNQGITPTDGKMENLVRRLKSRGVLIGGGNIAQGAAILPLNYLACLNKAFPND